MRKFYTSPEAEVVEFNTKDVITTSSGNPSNLSIPKSFTGESANEVQGWTGLFK